MKKYSYRDFARIGNTTIRTLRYYESIGLIEPIIEHEQKFINEKFLVQLQTIQLLKSSGYTLDEIKQILKDKNIEEHIIMQKDLLNIQSANINTMLSLIDTLQNSESMNIQNIYTEFLTIQNKQNLQLQFETPAGLKTRMNFHHVHTHFKENYHEWMFNHYQFHDNDKVLEIGCGDGTLWECNAHKIPNNIAITLTDISQEMLVESRNKLNKIFQVKVIEYADCYHLPYEDESFDMIIVNHVLMYFDELDDVLKEIYRVLKKGGLLYCSTIAKDMMKERDQLINKFDSKISFDQATLYSRFGYENGQEKLNRYFNQIELYDRKEAYEVADLELFYQFILSSMGLSPNLEPLYRKKVQFHEYLKDYFEKHKLLSLTIHTGMFKAVK